MLKSVFEATPLCWWAFIFPEQNICRQNKHLTTALAGHACGSDIHHSCRLLQEQTPDSKPAGSNCEFSWVSLELHLCRGRVGQVCFSITWRRQSQWQGGPGLCLGDAPSVLSPTVEDHGSHTPPRHSRRNSLCPVLGI